jgi:hypothetical protein
MAVSISNKSVKLTLSFLSITIAWALMNIINAVYDAMRHGKADDSGFVISWSGLLIALAWLIFIIYPFNKLDHSTKFFKPTVFPFVTTIYAGITYSIIVGGLFRRLALIMMFMPLALLTGFIFGLTYSLLISSYRLNDFLVRKPLARILAFLSPAILVLFFLRLLPSIAPAIVFRYMPDIIQTKIVRQTIPKFKVGDDVDRLKVSLPGYLDHIQNGSGNMSATMEGFGFVLQVHCGKIIRLEYGKSQFDYDGTIYGKLQEGPCP